MTKPAILMPITVFLVRLPEPLSTDNLSKKPKNLVADISKFSVYSDNLYSPNMDELKQASSTNILTALWSRDSLFYTETQIPGDS